MPCLASQNRFTGLSLTGLRMTLPNESKAYPTARNSAKPERAVPYLTIPDLVILCLRVQCSTMPHNTNQGFTKPYHNNTFASENKTPLHRTPPNRYRTSLDHAMIIPCRTLQSQTGLDPAGQDPSAKLHSKDYQTPLDPTGLDSTPPDDTTARNTLLCNTLLNLSGQG